MKKKVFRERYSQPEIKEEKKVEPKKDKVKKDDRNTNNKWA